MNFSEKLDAFVWRSAEKFKDDIWHHRFPDTKDYSPESMFTAGGASLKPIVLKLESAIKEHHELWNQGGYCMAECAILCKALAEIEEMLK